MRQERTGITVLLDTRTRHWNQNPYIRMLADGVSAGCDVRGFSWRFALFGTYDVLHVHWPEYLLVMRSPTTRMIARLFFMVLVVRLHLSRIAVVRTRHNRSSHVDVGRLDSFLLTLLRRQVVLEIRMNHVDVPPTDEISHVPTVHIPHGNYRPYIESLSSPPPDQRADATGIRLLAFGILRPYKKFDEVILAVAGAKPEVDVHLLVMGNSVDAAYTAALAELVDRAGDRVDLAVGRVEDSKLIAQMVQSDFVVVPYADLYSSGVALLSLSLDVPVVVRESDAAHELRDEFGDQWVRCYRGTLTPEVIEQMVADHVRTGRPAASVSWSTEREWTEIGQRTVAEYVRAVQRVRSEPDAEA